MSCKFAQELDFAIYQHTGHFPKYIHFRQLFAFQFYNMQLLGPYIDHTKADPKMRLIKLTVREEGC